jgi:non-ribosomal peptide synthetase component F
VDQPDTRPVSPSQAAQWYLWHLSPGSDAYHVPWTYELHGRVAFDSLAEALLALQDRHDVLRSTFHQWDGVVLQTVGPPAAITLDPLIVPGDSEDERHERALALAAAAARAPFDLCTGPPLRAAVWSYGPDRHVLLLVFHHIVIDEWSRPIVERDLSALYATEQGTPSILPPPVQYRHRGPQTDEPQADDLDYWVDQLSGMTPTPLPPDLHGPIESRRPASDSVVTLDHDVIAAFDRIARAVGTTRSVVLLALCWLFQARQTGSIDVCLGSPVAARERTSADEVVGFFLNTLALRGRLDVERGFAELVGTAHRTFAEALRHRHVPLDRVVRAVAPSRVMSWSPLVNVLYAYVRNDDTHRLVLTDVEVSGRHLPGGDAQLDLEITAFDEDGRISLSLRHATDRYLRSTADGWATVLADLARSVTADDQAPLRGLLSASRAELTRMTENRVGSSTARHILRRWYDSTQQWPERAAITTDGATLSFADAGIAVTGLAVRLSSTGVRRGDLVTLALPTGAAGVLATLAIWSVGATICPMGTVEDEFSSWRLCIESDTGTQRQQRLVVDPDPRTWSVHRAPAPQRADPPNDAAAFVVPGGGRHTASTWLTFAAVADHAEQWCKRLGSPSEGGQRIAVTVGPDSPLFLDQMLPLVAGHRLVTSDQPARLRPDGLLGLVGTGAVTALRCTADQLAALAAAGLPDRPGALALLYYSGRQCSAWSRDLLATALPAVTVAHVGVIGPDAPLVVGPALEHRPPGVFGELYFEGPGVAAARLGSPATTAAAFVPYPRSPVPGARMRRTGLRARRSTDGTVTEIETRRDHDADTGRPTSIERVLNDVPGVHQSVVVPSPADRGAFTAYLVCGPASGVTESALRAALATGLEFRTRIRFVTVPRLPFTSSGDIDRDRFHRLRHQEGQ